MVEQRVFLNAGDLTLEGLYAPSPGPRGVVIAHPHPLMGGNMRDGVVMAMVEVFRRLKYSTLRFNFRGVGRSEGLFGEGLGEVEDLRAAVEFLSSAGVGEIAVAGYSFGALVAARYVSRTLKERAASWTVLVSPPMKDMGVDFTVFNGQRGLMICGDSDPFCPVSEMTGAARLASWKTGVIREADHFLFGKEIDLMTLIRTNVAGTGETGTDTVEGEAP